MFDGEFAPEEERQPDRRRDGKGDDEAGAEPVVFLALVEHDLEAPMATTSRPRPQ